ncbi:hypothetical protein ACVC7V_02675 [Hydrogenophaga sp. A37]|uniref:hypothetical protein n=1 Tax=Hydrogenophaga sp. A37 TaxID=1945864 RepID=UPI0009876D06|nr:hypothetical protein [Hydrogenophaga sp. A37]OOG85995.1 hypothetical protein B0E41_07170 [Hydrogenophaga sp. A37]
MEKNTLFVKTDKGREALARRVPELGPRLRSMLILVDGQRSLSELDKLGSGLGGSVALLEQLLAHGWIAALDLRAAFRETLPLSETQSQTERPSAPGAAVVPVAEPSIPTTVVPQALLFADARRLVVRFINDHVGPSGEALALRVEACKNVAELQAQLPRVRDGLKSHRGAAMVQRFDTEVVPRLPTH